jgi:hypothetical protein
MWFSVGIILATKGIVMINMVTIQSIDEEGRLVFSEAERDSQKQPDYAVATLVLGGLLARTRIDLHQGEALINLFEDLATAGHDWKGEKYAETVEGELRLKCTCDNPEHTTMEVCLRSPQDYWVVKGVLLVENGQFEKIIRDLKEFFNLAAAGAF